VQHPCRRGQVNGCCVDCEQSPCVNQCRGAGATPQPRASAGARIYPLAAIFPPLRGLKMQQRRRLRLGAGTNCQRSGEWRKALGLIVEGGGAGWTNSRHDWFRENFSWPRTEGGTGWFARWVGARWMRHPAVGVSLRCALLRCVRHLLRGLLLLQDLGMGEVAAWFSHPPTLLSPCPFPVPSKSLTG